MQQYWTMIQIVLNTKKNMNTWLAVLAEYWGRISVATISQHELNLRLKSFWTYFLCGRKKWFFENMKYQKFDKNDEVHIKWTSVQLSCELTRQIYVQQ